MAARVEFPEPPSPPDSPPTTPAREEVSVWEADEEVWEGIEDATNMRLSIARTQPTTAELRAYLSPGLRRHRVPRLKLSPLRNETVEEEIWDDGEWG